ncbi:DAK2 domain-containing protein, partial [Streptomyces bambusae]|uniref:DAK2 domain-containing protein n=1 Tax=Streptomyces bambusae TaxID=1550616 RepID=UPI0027E1EE3D
MNPSPHEEERPVPHESHTLDADAVRTWSSLAVAALGQARADIDAINVFPVADADTGTNLYLTAESAAREVEAARARVTHGTPEASLAAAVRAYAHGALIGARGNSGTILAQLLLGMADVLGTDGSTGTGTGVDADADADAVSSAGPGGRLARALARAAESAYEAVAHPVEGTMLTVARAAAEAAGTAVRSAGAAHDP